MKNYILVIKTAPRSGKKRHLLCRLMHESDCPVYEVTAVYEYHSEAVERVIYLNTQRVIYLNTQAI